jgi:Uma2 family endonuclease
MSNPQLETYYTLEEYYALLKGSDRRFEYWDGEIVLMSGGSKEHGIIQRNLMLLIGNRLKEPCEPFGPDIAIKVEHKAGFVFPDLSVACNSSFEQHEQGIDLLTNPIVVCEVVSRRSGFRDHSLKRKAYMALESMHDYLVVETAERYVTQYVRGTQKWDTYIYGEPQEIVSLKSVGVALTLTEIYRGIEF